MNYQVTCVCGHRFHVSDAGVNRHVPCPQCNRALIPLVTRPESADSEPASTTPAPANHENGGAVATREKVASPQVMEATKRCVYCGEVILAVAKKCRYCGEFLDRAAPDSGSPDAAARDAAAAPEAKSAPAADDADPVFKLSVSQWDNFWKFLICITIAVVTGVVLHVLPPLRQYAVVGTMGTAALMMMLMYFFYLAAANARCVIRPARLETETGIFSKHVDTLELWRVIDINLKQSFVERVLGIGTIFLKTTDDATPLLELYQIPKARKVYKYLQEQVPKAARERGVVYIEK